MSTSTSKYVVTKLSEEKIVDMTIYIKKAIDRIDKFKTIELMKKALTKLLNEMYEHCRDLIHICSPLKEDLLSELPTIMELDPEPDENSEFTKACNRILAICKEPFVMEDEDAVCACRLSHKDDEHPRQCLECERWFVGQCALDNLVCKVKGDLLSETIHLCITCDWWSKGEPYYDSDLEREADMINASRKLADAMEAGEFYDSDD
jgi:aconitase B